MKNRLLLFDIDMTLVKSYGIGIGALERHFRDFNGYCGEVRLPRADGRCDRWIVEQLFTMNGIAYADSDYDKFMQGYLDELNRIFQAPAAELLPGVKDLLDALAGQDGIHLALLTGNDHRSARIKLEAFDLYTYFPAGAFGSDSAFRAELVPLALERAGRHYGKSFTSSQSIIIGDSVNDVLAAGQAGTHCIAVASGFSSKEELQAAGKCAIVDDLCDTGGIIKTIDSFED